MIDPSIALQYRGIQINDPLEVAGRAQSLRNMSTQNDLMQAHADDFRQKNALNQMRQQAMTQSGGDPVRLRATLASMGDMEGVSALDKQSMDTQKSQADLASTQAGTQEKLSKLRSQAAIIGFTGGTMQHAKMAADSLRQGGDTVGADHLDSLISQHPDATPEQIRSVFKPYVSSQLSADNLLMPKYQSAGGALVNTNPNAEAAPIPMTQSPDSIASLEQSKLNQDRIDARARETIAVGKQANTLVGGKQAFEAENKMADDHKAESKTFVDIRNGYTRIKSTLEKAPKSAAATLASATSFMKLLDPGSVVRESELGMALNATGIMDKVTNYMNTLQRGQVLTPSQAKDFKNISDKLYLAAEADQKKLDAQYTDRAKGYGLNPKNVIKDYTADTGSTKTQFESMPPPADHTGRRIKSDDGVIYKSNGKSWVRE